MRPHLSPVQWIALLPCALPLATAIAALTPAEIQAVRTASRQRCDDFFQREAGKPFVPAAIQKNWNKRGDFTRHYNQSVVLFAFRAFQLREQLPAANQALRDMCQYHLDRPQTLLEIHSFPWTLSMLPQLCRLYGPAGTRTPGLISPDTHALLLRTLWTWAHEKSKLADAEVPQSQTWYLTDSENHHANHFASCWAVSLLLAQTPEYRDRKYADRHTARAHYDAWTAYLRAYLRERARKGMTIEIDSPSYAVTTLSAFCRIHELTDDPVLKQRAGDYLTLFWALWAEQQLDGVSGGAKTRTYADSAKRGTDFMRRAAWYLLGLGDPNFVHASMLPFVTSSWAMPAVVIDLALPDEAVEKFGRWLICADDLSPVIVEVAPKSGGRDFAAFRRAVLARPVSVAAGVLAYTSLQGDRFTFFVDQSRPPQINGQPANLAPPRVYDSPFVQSAWNSGVVTVRKGDRRLVLDFNP